VRRFCKWRRGDARYRPGRRLRQLKCFSASAAYAIGERRRSRFGTASTAAYAPLTTPGAASAIPMPPVGIARPAGGHANGDDT
jgi:hypothetical protein